MGVRWGPDTAWEGGAVCRTFVGCRCAIAPGCAGMPRGLLWTGHLGLVQWGWVPALVLGMMTHFVVSFFFPQNMSPPS